MKTQALSLQRRIFAIMGIISGLILVQACGRELPSETPCNFVQNQNLQRVSWENNVPVDLYLDTNVPTEFEAPIRAAIARWNEIGQSLRGRDFFRLRGGSPGSGSPAQDSYSKIYVLNTWESNKSIEQARTTVYWTGSVIYEADIRINNLNFDYYFTDTPDYSKVHLESLIVHELGHVLGLAHTDSKTSVMQVSLANGKSRTEPGGIDVNSLKCEY
jgi:Matrixin